MKDSTKTVRSITEIYATLVGRVDDPLIILDRMAEQQSFDWYHAIQVQKMLKGALLETENAYIEADEAADNRLIVLPRSSIKPAKNPDRARPQE